MEKGLRMDEQRKAVRRKLRGMAPSISIPYIKSFLLPDEEETVVIRHDCRGESLVQIALDMSLSVESVRRRHLAALSKILQGSTNE